MQSDDTRPMRADGGSPGTGKAMFSLSDILGAYAAQDASNLPEKIAGEAGDRTKVLPAAVSAEPTSDKAQQQETRVLPSQQRMPEDVPENRAEEFSPQNQESFDFSDPRAVDDFADELSRAMEGEAKKEPVSDGILDRLGTLAGKYLSAGKRRLHKAHGAADREPEISDELAKRKKGLFFVRYRALAAIPICILMVILSFLSVAGRSLPFGIGTSLEVCAGVLAMLLGLVMLLCIEVVFAGAVDLIHLRPGAESLSLVSALFTVAHALVIMKQHTDTGAPLCAAAAISLLAAAYGRIDYRVAAVRALTAAEKNENAFGMVSEFADIQDKAVLRKIPGFRSGFCKNLAAADISEQFYGILSPILILGGLLFSGIGALVCGDMAEIAHCGSLVLGGAASFSAAFACTRPFRAMTKNLKNAGCVVAGWGGAAEIFDSDCVLVTDTDLFPAGTVTLNGYKVFEGFSPENSIRYGASLMASSGSSLSPVFRKLLQDKKLDMAQVENFQSFDGGGIGAIVDGARVFAGSGAFMNLRGIRIPESVNMKSGVFVVVEGRLAAAFALNYDPTTPIQGALFTIQNTRLSMSFGPRDFNVTPAMVQQKYHLRQSGERFLSPEQSYRLTERRPLTGCRAVGLVTAEGLTAVSELILRARHMKVVSELGAILSAVGSMIGFAFLFILLITGGFASANAGNVLIYQFIVCTIVLIVTSLPMRPR